MNAYTVACTTVLMATGALADRLGRKRIVFGVGLGFGPIVGGAIVAASSWR